jgi:AraC-like DNA-binding protein
VAKESGFTSLAYFSRAFRKYSSMTPCAYRKGHSLGGRPQHKR